VFGNAWLKLLSVGLALGLWMVVSGEETVERGLRVPLELTQVPAGLELLGVRPPRTVDVRVRGAFLGTLSRVGAGDVVAVLDLHTAQAGRRLFPLTSRPSARAVRRRDRPGPSVGRDDWRSSCRRSRESPESSRRSKAGRRRATIVGPLSSDPRTVEVIGPDSAVKRATEVVTEPVSVAGAKTHVKQTVIIGLLDVPRCG